MVEEDRARTGQVGSVLCGDAQSEPVREAADGDQAAGEIRLDLHVRAFEESAVL